jgi:signal transduction histidine kinase
VRPLTIKLLSVRRSLPLFLAVVVCLAFWQVWLTWRLMEQDRNLSAQQARERLEQIADLAVAQLGGALDGWELGLRDLDTLPPPAALNTKFPLNGTLVLLTQHSVTTYPHKPLLFVPDPPSGSPVSDAFDNAEKLEFRDQSYSGAIAVLRPLIDQPATRAEALLRSARLERRLNHSDAALANYDRLVRETSVNADGVPYALLASGARCELLPPGSARTAELQHLRTALSEGRWPLPHESFDYHWAEVNRLSHTSDAPPKNAAELSSLAALLHKEWQRSILTGASPNDREESADGSLLIWHATPSRLAALSAPTGWLDASLKLPAQAGDIRWRLLGSSEAASSGSTHIIRSLAEAHLAGKLEFSSLSVGVKHGLNRALWLTGVALMLLLVLAGAYAMHRGVSRELRVAVLQSDFVSAVSHEFRSPLTTLRSISELLVNNRISNESRVQQSYVFLERETARLQKLVEDLLDFGRMESGRKQYSIEPHDVFTLVRAAVADFRDEALGSGFEVAMNLDARAATVKADEEALRRAIRNLLENAQKYSPECRTVWVEGHVNHSQAMISVRDKGMGIDPREQPQIFQKFVRGAAAKKAGIKGTGIGLSMVRQIVEACGGDIRVESVVGSGSTFTIMLPLISERENGA